MDQDFEGQGAEGDGFPIGGPEGPGAPGVPAGGPGENPADGEGFDDVPDTKMGSDPFGDDGDDDGDSGNPEKEVESLIGKAASMIRKELSGGSHMDKKKEVLGMLVSAVIDGADDDERDTISDYVQSKIDGKGESEGDAENGSEDTSLDGSEDFAQDGDSEDGGQDFAQASGQEEISEAVVDRVLSELRLDNLRGTSRTADKVENKKAGKSYKSSPYTSGRKKSK